MNAIKKTLILISLIIQFGLFANHANALKSECKRLYVNGAMRPAHEVTWTSQEAEAYNFVVALTQATDTNSGVSLSSGDFFNSSTQPAGHILISSVITNYHVIGNSSMFSQIGDVLIIIPTPQACS